MKYVNIRNTNGDSQQRIVIEKVNAETILEVKDPNSLSHSFNEGGTALSMCLASAIGEITELQPFNKAIIHYMWNTDDGRDLDTHTAIRVPDRRHISVGYGQNNRDEDFLQWGGDNRGDGRESIAVDFTKLIAAFPEQEEFEVEVRCWWWAYGFDGGVITRLETFMDGEFVRDGNYGFDNVGGVLVQSIDLDHIVTLQRSSVIPGVEVARVYLNKTTMRGDIRRINGEEFQPLTIRLDETNRDETYLVIHSSVNDIIDVRLNGQTFSTGFTDYNGEFRVRLASHQIVDGNRFMAVVTGGPRGEQRAEYVIYAKRYAHLDYYDVRTATLTVSGGRAGETMRLIHATHGVVASDIVGQDNLARFDIPTELYVDGDEFTFELDGKLDNETQDSFVTQITDGEYRYVTYVEQTPATFVSISDTASAFPTYTLVGPEFNYQDGARDAENYYEAIIVDSVGIPNLTATLKHSNYAGYYPPGGHPGPHDSKRFYYVEFSGDLTDIGEKRISFIVRRKDGGPCPLVGVMPDPQDFNMTEYGGWVNAVYFNKYNSTKHTPVQPPRHITEYVYSRLPNHPSISTWDVSHVKRFSWTFQTWWPTNSPTVDITGWDMSGAEDLSYMFAGDYQYFNQDLSNWNVSNVKNMSYMFAGQQAISFDFNEWDVSSVEDMSYMFTRAPSFNQPLNTWNVGKVKTFEGMFKGAGFFNGDISSWNTSSATNMIRMFENAESFNQDISGWDVSNVTSMYAMFSGARSIKSNLGGWNVSNCTDFSYMFRGCFNTVSNNLNNWDVSKATSLAYMFSSSGMNPDINSWNTSNVTNMEGMFSYAHAFDKPIGNWNTSKVTNMKAMFSSDTLNEYTITIFNQDISGWDTGNVTTMERMFAGAQSFNKNISNWNTSKVQNFTEMFYKAKAFNQPIGDWNVSSATHLTGMFRNADNFNQPLKNWNVSQAWELSYMFNNAKVFDQDISTWNTKNLVQVSNMFSGAVAFSYDLSQWCVPKVTNGSQFANGATLFTADKYPVWGTCPRGENNT